MSQIFKNEEILLPEYLPLTLPHRENQIKLLAEYLEPASKNQKPFNVFIFGPTGIGKTAVTKYVFREFESFYLNVKTIYLNCWEYRTSLAILGKICLDLGFFVQLKGWSKKEVLDRCIEALRKLKKSLIICLDEVDQLKKDALYDLLRINQHVNLNYGIVFISNQKYALSNLDPRISSSLDYEEIEFKPYSLMEMRDILKERAKEAFFSIDSSAILLASNYAVKRGSDVRIGLQTLLKAGRIAERLKDEQVKAIHVKKVLKEEISPKKEIIMQKIGKEEKILLNILEESKMITVKDLYSKYKNISEKPLTERQIRKYVERFLNARILSIEIINGKRFLVWQLTRHY